MLGEDAASSAEPWQFDALPVLAEAVPDAVLAVDARGRIVFHNRRALELFGYEPDELVGEDVHALIAAPQRVRRGLLEPPPDPRSPLRVQRKLLGRRRDGGRLPILLSIAWAPSTREALVVAVIADLSERQSLTRELDSAAGQAGAIAHLAEAALVGADFRMLVRRAVEAVRNCLGVDRASLLELGDDDRSLVLAGGCGWPPRLLGRRLAPLPGTHPDPETALAALEDYGIRSSVWSWVGQDATDRRILAAHSFGPRDFSVREHLFVQAMAGLLDQAQERHATESRLRRGALEDGLTGLGNRTLFMERLEHWLARASRSSERGAVIFLDLDKFKWINDTLGHDAGDEVLRVAARRIRAEVRAETTVSRYGGDEFALLLEGLRGDRDPLLVAARIQHALGRPIRVGARELRLSASMGIARPGNGASSGEEIMRHADAAMYVSKRAGGARVRLFDDRLHRTIARRLSLERRLRTAIEADEFTLVYHPMVRLEDLRLVGFEALVRWQREDRLMAPADFLPAAEESELIAPLGAKVLELACSEAAAWRQRFPADAAARVSVNLSPGQLTAPGLVPHVANALRRTGLEPARLSLEIPERALVGEADSAPDSLRRLRALGVGLTLDEFGAGRASLSLLHELPFDSVKIAGTCVHRVDRRAERRAIVAGIARTAAELGIDTVAGRVQRAAERAELERLGCAFAQGFHFARPLDREQTADALARGHVTPPSAAPAAPATRRERPAHA
jgi:diguanylate cyclase (GGDEF)-like protein/PAS domain S-box-containing protein